MFGVEPTIHAGRLALEIYAEVLAGVEPRTLIQKSIRREGRHLFIQEREFHLDAYERVIVCGAGKASAAMADALAEHLHPYLTGGLVVAPDGSVKNSNPVRTVYGDHPLPGTRSVAAGEAMLEFAAQTTTHDLVIFCLSGGASALIEAPLEGISLEQLRAATDELMRAGADIHTLNAVRRRLSRIKGGGLARAFEAEVVVMVLSDVIGGDLSVVGSGPFLLGRPGHRAHAVAFGLQDRLPARVLEALTANPPAPVRPVPHFVVGSASLLWPLAEAAAKKRGMEPIGYADPLKGEARTMAGRIMRLARAKRKRGEHDFCMVFVGETTVTVKGAGKGGRSQELTTQAAGSLVAEPGMALLAAGTDGIDGPTDAASGLSEPGSVARA
ncbi:MAG TPA: DUF4147 domain-containing protein, partial [Fimbriimonadaceae bacterium]|nr:DUF4147 domain-containing protein [Fimbriimonadaceae bacterium]